jgi:hypothetical protein
MADSSTSGVSLAPFSNSNLPAIKRQLVGSAPIAEMPKLSKVVPVARLKQEWILGAVSLPISRPL